jgi:hypothetical protein
MWAAPWLWAPHRPGGQFISVVIDGNLAFRHFADQAGHYSGGDKFVGVLVKPTAQGQSDCKIGCIAICRA